MIRETLSRLVDEAAAIRGAVESIAASLRTLAAHPAPAVEPTEPESLTVPEAVKVLRMRASEAEAWLEARDLIVTITPPGSNPRRRVSRRALRAAMIAGDEAMREEPTPKRRSRARPKDRNQRFAAARRASKRAS